MMQKFWDSAMAIGPIEEDDETRRFSALITLWDFCKNF